MRALFPLSTPAELLPLNGDAPPPRCYEVPAYWNETRTGTMARKPRDYDAELQAIMDKAKKLRGQKTTQLGELVQVTGADALPIEALAGALLAAVEQSKKQPDAVKRWAERGEAFFRVGRGRGGSKKAGPGDAVGGPHADSTGAAASDGGA